MRFPSVASPGGKARRRKGIGISPFSSRAALTKHTLKEVPSTEIGRGALRSFQ